MTIWEKTVLNMEKGTRKLTIAAATFSDWVKVELAVIRLRIRIDEVQAGIAELHRKVGRKVAELNKQDALPRQTEQLMKDEVVSSAMTELGEREQELAELAAELKKIRSDLQSTEKQTEDTLA